MSARLGSGGRRAVVHSLIAPAAAGLVVLTAGPALADTPAAVNHAPVAVDDLAQLTDGYASIPVLANDSDPDGDALTITSISAPAHGTTQNDVHSLRYHLDDGIAGYVSDSFTYTVSDGHGGTATGHVVVASQLPAPDGLAQVAAPSSTVVTWNAVAGAAPSTSRAGAST